MNCLAYLISGPNRNSPEYRDRPIYHEAATIESYHNREVYQGNIRDLGEGRFGIDEELMIRVPHNAVETREFWQRRLRQMAIISVGAALVGVASLSIWRTTRLDAFMSPQVRRLSTVFLSLTSWAISILAFYRGKEAQIQVNRWENPVDQASHDRRYIGENISLESFELVRSGQIPREIVGPRMYRQLWLETVNYYVRDGLETVFSGSEISEIYCFWEDLVASPLVVQCDSASSDALKISKRLAKIDRSSLDTVEAREEMKLVIQDVREFARQYPDTSRDYAHVADVLESIAQKQYFDAVRALESFVDQFPMNDDELDKVGMGGKQPRKEIEPYKAEYERICRQYREILDVAKAKQVTLDTFVAQERLNKRRKPQKLRDVEEQRSKEIKRIHEETLRDKLALFGEVQNFLRGLNFFTDSECGCHNKFM